MYDTKDFDHSICITCYVKASSIAKADMIMAIGNLESQHVTSYGYCAMHGHFIITEFHNGQLILARGDGDPTQHADAAYVKWGDGHAYFV
jgi:hypothetical protein